MEIPKIVHSPMCMVLAGLIARELYIVASQCFRVAHWGTFEMATIGGFMATGHGFTLNAAAGPSAWTAPLYPFVVALIFQVFGIFSPASAFAILLFNSLCAALTSWTIYGIARRLFAEGIAVWSGWIWAFLPGSIYFSAFWIWETTLSAFLLSLLFLLTLRMENDQRLLPWCGYGLLWGVAGLTNPSLLTWLPFSGCWLAYRLHRRGQRYVLPAVLGSVVFWLALSPWLTRNYIVFGEPLLLRGGFGANLRAGNNPESEGSWVIAYTYNNPVLLAQYIRMGEAEYVSEQGRLAREWIAAHPSRFLVLSLRRFAFFWIGNPHEGLQQVKNVLFSLSSVLSIGGLVLAIKRRMHGVFLFATLAVSYPFVYYLTFPQMRYRHPIEPELLILAVFWISSGFGLSTVQIRRQAYLRVISSAL
jgi:4-amino-4-deoxy-L-arabinose transferase-like glycosyltransferase